MAISDALGDARSVRLPQGLVAYRERGTGPPIVFVHGALVNGDLWRNVVPTLAATHRCITPDLPMGANATPLAADADVTPPGVARLIADFMAALELEDVTLVANDAGGAVSQILVTSDPSRVSRLVLTPCDSFRGFPPRYLKPMRWFGLLPGMMPLVIRMVSLAPVSRLIFWSAAKHPIDPAIVSSYTRPLRESRLVRRDLGKFFRDTRPRHTLEAARRLPRFDRPTLIAWAADELWFPVRNARRLAALIPDARLEIVADSRTLLPEDQPETLSRLIAGFLDEPAGRAVVGDGRRSSVDRSPDSRR